MSDCIICFHCTKGDSTITCSQCKQQFHHACYEKWRGFTNQNPAKCIHCQRVGHLEVNIVGSKRKIGPLCLRYCRCLFCVKVK